MYNQVKIAPLLSDCAVLPAILFPSAWQNYSGSPLSIHRIIQSFITFSQVRFCNLGCFVESFFNNVKHISYPLINVNKKWKKKNMQGCL